MKVDFFGVDTLFSVEAVFKGKVEKDTLTVLHYRLKAGHSIQNGPLLVWFRTKGFVLDTKRATVSLGTPPYLLFLKKRKDGRYEAVSGQVDPELAVREMYTPLFKGVEKPGSEGCPL